jgi:hypothetical protein
MNKLTLSCQDEQRRHAVRAAVLNGLDYLEVSDDQYTLTVYLLGKAPRDLVKENFRIKGGRRIRNIQVVDLDIACHDEPERDDCIQITVDRPGDFSCYCLCIVALDEEGRPTDTPHPDFDRRYACLEFSFKAGCPSDLDCRPEQLCPPQERVEPDINYLAKDYASFRQLILDRLSLIMPDWRERHIPDFGITLVEILAYAGDHLSYYQDAVASEAYLETARQRISVRRHVRLVDYAMHEGCNARAWLCLKTSANLRLRPQEVYFITGYNGVSADGHVLNQDDLRNVPAGQYEVFEPLVEEPAQLIQLYEAHNTIYFYTWGDQDCCLPRGATTATLRDEWLTPSPPEEGAPAAQQKPAKATPAAGETAPTLERKLHLNVGDVLIFEEVKGPKTGAPADADPGHRHAVRLTRVEPGVDALYQQQLPGFDQPLPVPIVEIEWAEADALPFPVCISALRPTPPCDLLEDISVGRGNIILVDHGRTIAAEPLGNIPLAALETGCAGQDRPADVATRPGPFRPALAKGPLTFSQPLPPQTPAANSLAQAPAKALPQIELTAVPAMADGSAALFRLADLQDPAPLAAKLRQAEDPIARYLRWRLTPQTSQLLNEYEGSGPLPETLRVALVADLTALLETWRPQPDLLASQVEDRHFVAELDGEGRAYLRFGDGELGRRPEAGVAFWARYRLGNGPAGNVGAETISHVVLHSPGAVLSGVKLWPRNPLPAQGGTPPEPLAEVKLLAPYMFRRELQRAIIADDYARLAERHPKLQRAAASLRWTGSWYEALVTLDQVGSVTTGEALPAEIAGYLHPYRRIGHDLAAAPADYVALKIAMTVCVSPHYRRGHVKAELLRLFSNRALPDGRRGFFHPDRLSFGEGIYLSKLVAAAQAVPGVESVQVTQLERLYEGPNGEIEHGLLRLGPLEIARLDNDPSFPENGQLYLELRGGL